MLLLGNGKVLRVNRKPFSELQGAAKSAGGMSLGLRHNRPECPGCLPGAPCSCLGAKEGLWQEAVVKNEQEELNCGRVECGHWLTAERWRLEGAQVLGGRAGALPVPAGKRLKYPLRS